MKQKERPLDLPWVCELLISPKILSYFGLTMELSRRAADMI